MTKQATCPLQRQVPNTAPSFSHSGARYKSLSWFSQLTTGGKRLKKKKNNWREGQFFVDAAIRLPKCFTEVHSALGAELAPEAASSMVLVMASWL